MAAMLLVISACDATVTFEEGAVYATYLAYEMTEHTPEAEEAEYNEAEPEGYISSPDAYAETASDEREYDDEIESVITYDYPEETEADITYNNPEEAEADTTYNNPDETEADTTYNNPEETEADITYNTPEVAEATHTYANPHHSEAPPFRFMVAIDPGHQGRGDYTREPNGPGSTTYKARVATGTRGVSTGIPEYQFVLEMSLLLRDELLARGIGVFMVRETNDINISNSQRAIAASESGADIFIRVHANGSANRDVHGIMTLTSSRNNPYIPHLYEESRALSEAMLQEMVAATGARNLGVTLADNMTGNNWSSIPVTIIEMGFMTNPSEDELMQTEEYQRKLITGMADGIERFFSERA